ncbi:hypothetical protein [Veillonella parvula]|uniref:hypothetical protein n=1 Tax=Veillonella parvula TaxID=29466 RepID=UPI003AB8B2BC
MIEVYNLRKLLEAIPDEFDVIIRTPFDTSKHTAEIKGIYIDFENEVLIIGEMKK